MVLQISVIDGKQTGRARLESGLRAPTPLMHMTMVVFCGSVASGGIPTKVHTRPGAVATTGVGLWTVHSGGGVEG